MRGGRTIIHFSFFGPGFAARLITQMYFPGDPLLEMDPIFLSSLMRRRAIASSAPST